MTAERDITQAWGARTAKCKRVCESVHAQDLRLMHAESLCSGLSGRALTLSANLPAAAGMVPAAPQHTAFPQCYRYSISRQQHEFTRICVLLVTFFNTFVPRRTRIRPPEAYMGCVGGPHPREEGERIGPNPRKFP